MRFFRNLKALQTPLNTILLLAYFQVRNGPQHKNKYFLFFIPTIQKKIFNFNRFFTKKLQNMNKTIDKRFIFWYNYAIFKNKE